MGATTIFRTYGAGQWTGMDAAEIANGLNTPVKLQKMTLTTYFMAAMAAGATLADIDSLGEKWGGRYIDRASQALLDGDLAGISVLLALALGVTDETKAALSSVVAARTLSAGAVNWDGGELPSFTAEWVAGALNDIGWTWNAQTEKWGKA